MKRHIDWFFLGIGLIALSIIIFACVGCASATRAATTAATAVVNHQTATVEKVQAAVQDKRAGIDADIADLMGQLAKKQSESAALTREVDQARLDAIKNTVLWISCILIFGAVAAAIASIYFRSLSLASLAAASVAGIAVAQFTGLVVSHPLISSGVVAVAAIAGVIVCIVKHVNVRNLLTDAVTEAKKLNG